MNLELAIQIATLASVIIGFASLLFFVNSFRREMNARVVMEYSMRFAQLMDEFPDEFYEEWEIGQDLAPSSARLRRSIIKYLNLTAEEYYMQRRGYMLREVWKIWEPDIIRMLQNRLTVREWKELEDEFIYPDFVRFVNAAQKGIGVTDYPAV